MQSPQNKNKQIKQGTKLSAVEQKSPNDLVDEMQRGKVKEGESPAQQEEQPNSADLKCGPKAMANSLPGSVEVEIKPEGEMPEQAQPAMAAAPEQVVPEAIEAPEASESEVPESSEGPDKEVMDMLMGACPEGMSLIDFVKSLVAPKQESQQNPAIEEMAASTTVLSNTVKSLNVTLSQAKGEIERLKQELKKEQRAILSTVISDAVAKGKILDSEKEIFTKLGESNRNLFDEMLALRNASPKIVLSRITKSDESNVPAKPDVALSERDIKMLKGAKIKV